MKNYINVIFIVILIVVGCKKDENNPINPNPTNTGTINGVVTDRDSGAFIQGATVRTVPATSEGITNDSGKYSINSVPAGSYKIVPEKSGYVADTSGVIVSAGKTSTVNFYMNQGTPGAPNAPQLLEPIDSAIDIPVNITLIWLVSGGAESYQVQVSQSKTFSTLLYNQSGITITQYALSNLTALQKYYWRVRAFNSLGNSGWSSPRSFTITLGRTPSAPILVEPVSIDSVQSNTTFKWKSSPGAVSYSLHVSKSTSFNPLKFSFTGVKDTSLLVNNLDSGRTHYWRVNASNSYGTSSWSSGSFLTFGFLPPTPQLISPTNGDTGISILPLLSWNSVSTDTSVSYNLQIALTNDFSGSLVVDKPVTSTQIQLFVLTHNKLYYWRMRSKNDIGYSNWSPVWNFKTIQIACAEAPSVLYEGKSYNTVKIGSQCWLRENLDVGSMKTSASSADSMRNNGIIEKYCYSNLTTNCDLYGGLYQWSEAMQYITTSGSQGVCPPGWHIPTSSEFQTLSSSVGGSGYALLKIGQSSGTNTSDFNGLLTGYRSSGGSFSSLSSTTYLLTSDSYSSTNTTYYYLSSNTISSGNISKATGFSVRCLKNN